MEDMLVFDGVCAGYGRINVLNGLSFAVQRGQVLGVIGPNGSGKTTMLNALTGLIQPTAGRIRLEDRDITRLTIDARCRMGIGRTFQVPRPFERMSVYENVLAAAVFGAGLSERRAREPAMDVLRVTGLYERRSELSGALTLLDRKRLEIARAIVAKPKLLLLDEVAAGLTGIEIRSVMTIVDKLRDGGFTIVWIEHVLETMLRGTDSLMCIAEGKNVMMGPPETVIHSSVVEELYLGTGAEDEINAED